MSVHSLWNWKSASLGNSRTITGMSMLVAAYTALSFFTIPLSPTLRISFSFLALAASCALYGFWPNMIFAFAADLLGWLVNPSGSYMPLFALILMVKAFIYVLFFYRKDSQRKISVWRIIAAQSLVVVICNLILNPMVLMLLYQMPYWSLLLSRLLKNIVLLPVECLCLYLLFQALPRLKKNI